MKEFKYALLVTFVTQLISWLIFSLLYELIPSDSTIACIVGILIGILIIVFYFIGFKKMVVKHKLRPLLHNVWLFITWGLFTILITYGLFTLVDNGILHKCAGDWSCFLNGIEYLLYGTFLLAVSTVIMFVRLIIDGFKYIMKITNNK
jgi:xanthosine utilization system XapX-like protein